MPCRSACRHDATSGQDGKEAALRTRVGAARFGCSTWRSSGERSMCTQVLRSSDSSSRRDPWRAVATPQSLRPAAGSARGRSCARDPRSVHRRTYAACVLRGRFDRDTRIVHAASTGNRTRRRASSWGPRADAADTRQEPADALLRIPGWRGSGGTCAFRADRRQVGDGRGRSGDLAQRLCATPRVAPQPAERSEGSATASQARRRFSSVSISSRTRRSVARRCLIRS